MNEILSFKKLMEEGFIKDPDPIVYGLFNHGELIILTAPAKTGKSLLGLDLCISVATGTSFLNRFDTKEGKVLLIQSEVTPSQIKKRLKQKLGIRDE